jgi:Predicted translation initiation factor 2B subunit, eIF-2B alpha/beta/delta family
MFKRLDDNLAFILKYENVAWYDNGKVRMLDRRIYPIQTRFEECSTHLEVAKAIKDMVTQSWGPYFAAGMGMALAAKEYDSLGKKAFEESMTKAAYTLSHARPTTAAHMMEVTNACLKAALDAKEAGKNPVNAAFESTLDYYTEVYSYCEKMGTFLAGKIPQNGTVMTQCWAETVVGMMLRALRKNNNEAKFFCPETRPYFQGARLTASCICDMGFDVTVITDNMPGYVLKKKNVDVFTSAADVICVDGTVCNKVGTFQIALCCNYYGIPYYVTGKPNKSHPDAASLNIEERDPDLVIHAFDTKTVMDGVKGYYPAFDITPPSLVTGVVTDKKIYRPADLHNYYND